MEGASLSTAAQVPERGKQPKIDEGPSSVPGIDVVDLDIISPSLESKEIIQQLRAEMTCCSKNWRWQIGQLLI